MCKRIRKYIRKLIRSNRKTFKNKYYEKIKVNEIVTKKSIADGRKYATALLAGIGALSVASIAVLKS